MGSLARALVRWRWAVLLVWMAAGIVGALKAPDAPGRLNLRGGTGAVSEASRNSALINQRFPQSLGEYLAVTLEAKQPIDSGRPREVYDTLVARLQRAPFVQAVAGWGTTKDSTFIAKDRKSTFLVAALKAPGGDSAGALVVPLRKVAREAIGSFPDSGDYTLRVTGRSALDLDVRTLTIEDGRRSELQLLPLTFVILVLAFGALVAAALPLLIGFLAIVLSLAIIGELAAITPMSIFVLNITTMIGLGVGIDYSLLIVTRFREELANGLNRRDAAAEAAKTAGHAVLVSGATVVVGFAALLLTPLVETRSVGIGGLVVVGVAVLLSTTLLPALLAFLGRNIDRPKWLAARLAWYHSPLFWEKWARSVTRHPWRAMAVGGGVIALLTVPVFGIRIGLPSRGWWPTHTEAGQGVEVLSKMGVAGYIQPVRVAVELPEGKTAVQTASLRGLMTLRDSLRADPRVREVRSIVDLKPGTGLLEYSVLYSELDSARAQYKGFLDSYLSADARVALLDVIPSDTTSLTSAMELVRKVRALAKAPPRQLRDAEITVGGYAASSVDSQDNLLARFPLIVGLILGVTALMLAVAFRSVLIPLKAIVLNSLSVSATFGLIVLVFQYGFGAKVLGLEGATSAIFVVVPVLVFAVVFGLSMDYEVFLLSRIKEAYDRTGRNDEATLEGVSATASVITSAALIMIIVFGVFAFARVLAMQFLGFGLAMAVLLDATLIRMVLVPAFMQVAGRWNWWPGSRT